VESNGFREPCSPVDWLGPLAQPFAATPKERFPFGCGALASGVSAVSIVSVFIGVSP